MPTDRSTAAGSRSPDPVGGLRFKVTANDAEIGRFSECSGLAVEWDVFEYQEGGQNDFVHKIRGRAKYPNLVLKRGITHEDALQKWFFQSKEWSERGSVTIELVGPDTQPVRRWAFDGAFPVKWQGPTLNASSNDAATETLEIAHRGFSQGS